MLHLLLALPFATAVIAAFFGNADQKAVARWGVFASTITALFGVITLGSTGVADAAAIPWFTLWGTDAVVYWHLQADGLSTWLVHIVTFLTPVVLLASSQWIGHRMREFVVATLVMQGAMIGALLAADLVVFYMFFEGMLIPLILLVALFGDKDAKGAAMQFFIYTMFGSIFMLVGIWFLANELRTTNMALVADMLPSLNVSPTTSVLLFIAFAFAFAVKAPLMPFHSWQARIYAAAPAGASALLAGAMAKVGVYGFVRIVLPTFPEEMELYGGILMTLALIGVIAGALMAMVQTDVKRLLAFSSLSHLSLVLVGVFSREQTALEGVVVQMVAHGLAVAALFLVVGALEHRRGSRDITAFGGIAASRPGIAVLFIGSMLAAVAIPGTAGFVGEFLVLLGTAQSATGGLFIAALAGTSLILGAVYLLRVTQAVCFGPEPEAKPLARIGAAEALAVIPLLVGSLWLGFHPTIITDANRPVVQGILYSGPAEFATEYDDSQADDLNGAEIAHVP